MNAQYQKGVIDGTGTVNVPVGGREAPLNAVLTSTATNRAINLSENGLATPAFAWPVDMATAGMIAVSTTVNISHFQFVGNPGDVWEVR